MKRAVIIGIIILLAFNLSAQRSRRNNVKWIGVGAVGEYGVSNLFNYAVQNDEHVSQNFININYAYGGKLGVTFGETIDLSIEALNHRFTQQYEIRPYQGGIYTKRLKFNSLDMSLIFKYTSFAGIYVEAGPRFSMLTHSDVVNSNPEMSSQPDSVFSTGMKGVVAGVGFVLYSSFDDRFRVNFGLRASYAIDDLMKDPSHSIVADELYYPYYETTYPTQLFTLTAKIELVYYPVYYGKAGCGKSRWVFK